MMWLNERQYGEILVLTAGWTMDQLVALTYFLAQTHSHSWKKVLEEIARLGDPWIV